MLKTRQEGFPAGLVIFLLKAPPPKCCCRAGQGVCSLNPLTVWSLYTVMPVFRHKAGRGSSWKRKSAHASSPLGRGRHSEAHFCLNSPHSCGTSLGSKDMSLQNPSEDTEGSHRERDVQVANRYGEMTKMAFKGTEIKCLQLGWPAVSHAYLCRPQTQSMGNFSVGLGPSRSG